MSQQLKDFFSTDTTDQITKKLLGTLLVYHSDQGLMSGYVTEAEAYLGKDDTAAHAYNGRRTPSNEALYDEPGTIYIYSIHSRLCLDVAAQAKDIPEGILIRGIEPKDGLDIMNQNRQKHGFDLTNGPGKLMEALGITDKKMNRIELGDTKLDLDLENKKIPAKIMAVPRIGVGNSGWANKPYRYYVQGNPFVSKMAKRDMDLKSYGWK